MFNNRLYYILFIIFLHNNSETSYANNNSYGKTKKTSVWKKIDIISYKNFPYHSMYKNINIHGCSKKNNSSGILILRCIIKISLLRKSSVANKWKRIQQENGCLSLNFKKAGIKNEKSRIISITPLYDNTVNTFLPRPGLELVTGVFKYPTLNVRQYKVQFIKTGAVSTINATPSHLFYVKNKKSFIPLSNIVTTDRLITGTGKQVKLLCPSGRETTCGSIYHKGVPVYVYNLEVNKKHTYFIGTHRLLAHNNCEKLNKLLGLNNHSRFPEDMEKGQIISDEEVKCEITGNYVPKSEAVQIYSGTRREITDIMYKNPGFWQEQISRYGNDEQPFHDLLAPFLLETEYWYKFEDIKRLIFKEENSIGVARSPETALPILGLVDYHGYVLKSEDIQGATHGEKGFNIDRRLGFYMDCRRPGSCISQMTDIYSIFNTVKGVASQFM